jgi:hypothetical protein
MEGRGMTWTKVSDDFSDHPKVQRLARDPRVWADSTAMWLACMCYCNKYLTDGLLPRAYVLTRATPMEPAAALAAADELVRVGLWTTTPEGDYQVHDFLDYNPSAAAEKVRRAADAERKRQERASARTSETRPPGRPKGRPDGCPPDIQSPSDRPDPDPDPGSETESEPRAHTHAHAHNGQASEAAGATISAAVDRDPTAAEIRAPGPNGAASKRADTAWQLAQLHDQVGDKVARAHGKGWRTLGTRGPGEWSVLLVNGTTEEECRHVLAMLAAEADERARLGMADPLRFLRTPMAPEIWRRAAGLPDEEAAREAVRARAAGNSNQPPPAPEPKRRARRLG